MGPEIKSRPSMILNHHITLYPISLIPTKPFACESRSFDLIHSKKSNTFPFLLRIQLLILTHLMISLRRGSDCFKIIEDTLIPAFSDALKIHFAINDSSWFESQLDTICSMASSPSSLLSSIVNSASGIDYQAFNEKCKESFGIGKETQSLFLSPNRMTASNKVFPAYSQQWSRRRGSGDESNSRFKGTSSKSKSRSRSSILLSTVSRMQQSSSSFSMSIEKEPQSQPTLSKASSSSSFGLLQPSNRVLSRTLFRTSTMSSSIVSDKTSVLKKRKSLAPLKGKKSANTFLC